MMANTRDPKVMNAPSRGEIILRSANIDDWYDGDMGRRKRFIDVVCETFQKPGFNQVTHPGLTNEFMAEVDEVTDSIFDLPESVLRQYVTPLFQRGYAPQGAEHAKDNPDGDWKRFFMIRDPDQPFDPGDNPFGPNIDIKEEPRFLPLMLKFLQFDKECGLAVFGALEEGYNARGKLLPFVRGPETMKRPICYDPMPDELPAGAWRSAPHEDINLITCMAAKRSLRGLDLLVDGVWYSVVAETDGYVVDVGEMLTEIPEFSGLIATTHRVHNPPLGDPFRKMRRKSYPAFMHGLLSWIMRYEEDRPVCYRDLFMKRIREIAGDPVPA